MGNTEKLLDGKAAVEHKPDGKLDGFTVKVGEKDYKVITKETKDTTDPYCYVEFSARKQFTREEDMQGAGGNWVDAMTIPSSSSLQDYRSFRVTIPDNQVTYTSGEGSNPKTKITITFEAYADQNGNLEGLSAWNSFAYSYQYPDSEEITGNWNYAQSRVVGVGVPYYPKLQKKVTDRVGMSRQVNADTPFYFLVYEDDASGKIAAKFKARASAQLKTLWILGANGVPTGLTEEAKTELGEKKYQIVTVTVPNKETNALASLYKYEFWQPNSYYTIQELEVDDKFRFDGFSDTDTGRAYDGSTVTFQYTPTADTSFTVENAYLPWDLKLTKIDSRTVDAPVKTTLSGAVFALYSMDQNDAAKGKYANVSTWTYESGERYLYGDLSIPTNYVERITATDSVNWYLIDLVTTDSTGAMVWTGLQQERYQYTEFKAPDGYYMPTVTHWDVRATDDGTMVTKGAAVEYEVAQYVPNTPGVELPATGGAGAGAYTFFGAGLMALAMLALILRKRKNS